MPPNPFVKELEAIRERSEKAKNSTEILWAEIHCPNVLAVFSKTDTLLRLIDDLQRDCDEISETNRNNILGADQQISDLQRDAVCYREMLKGSVIGGGPASECWKDEDIDADLQRRKEGGR